ncbi:holo-ACP synthase [Salinicoccus albus]|uniref:holo-ACP synthase n=1 Tax=Salinicoccus albus TaxID=418756 RepID=UPI00036BFFF6|nr:holo-ACP synthase [Salinicoccus albus]
MILGLGTDIIEVNRIRNIESKNSRLSERILAPEEMEYYHKLNAEKRRLEYLSGRFAVKEAYSKALGTGIGSAASFKDIVCLNDAAGKPFIKDDRRVHVSISHAEEYAVATVIIEDE